MKLKILLSLFLGALVLTQCDIPDEAPDWNPDYYGPIAKSDINIEEISKLSDIIFEQEVQTTSVNSNFQGEVQQVPPFTLSSRVGPYEFEISDIFEKVRTDSMIFRIAFTNNYPINIRKGTILTFENKTNGNIVYRHEIQQDVAPGEQYSFREELYDKVVESNINFYIDSFSSDGSQSKVDFGQGTTNTFKFELIFLEIDEMIIETNKSYSIQDTTQFNFDEADTNTSARGQLFVYFENKFPMKFDVQLYLLDENKNLTDSLFENPVSLGGSPVNQQGRIIGKEIETVDTVELKESNIRSFQKASFIAGRIKVQTVNQSVSGGSISNLTLEVEENSYLRLQVAGDIQGAVQ